MLDLLDPGADLDPGLLSVPGSFAWWYLDLVDSSGDGMVLIWAFGLPFLVSRGLARERPSLALSVYKDGRPEYVLLTELERADFGPGWWEMGGCRLEETLDGGSRRLRASLRLESPHGLLEGEVQAEGPLLRGGGEAGPHGWTPLMGLGSGRARLRSGDWSWSCEGECYRDRNQCDRPLGKLGIDRWTWGRAGVDGRLVSWYLVEGEQPSARVFLEEGGALVERRVTVTEAGRRLDRYGLRWARELRLQGEVDLVVRQGAPLDRGPFYLRHPVTAELDGRAGRGWGELVVPDRIDLPLMRPLVEMRTQRQGRNSPFLGLFSGPRPTLGWL